MAAIQKFKKSLIQQPVDEKTMSEIFHGYENISDQSKKERKAAFFMQAINTMDETLTEELCHDIRVACVCSTRSSGSQNLLLLLCRTFSLPISDCPGDQIADEGSCIFCVEQSWPGTLPIYLLYNQIDNLFRLPSKFSTYLCL